MNPPWQRTFLAAPPYAPITPWLNRLPEDDCPSLTDLNTLADSRGIWNEAGLALRFVAQDVRCGQRDYELSILAGGAVPTRERNWHDLFNALVWLTWTNTKAVLNAVQCGELRAGRRRGPVSDAVTLFDESGMVLVGEADELIDLLRAHRWHEALVERRADWSRLRAYVIGHAVFEKLLAPWPGITAKCQYLRLPADAPISTVDAALAESWQARHIHRPADLFPMPVLGVPGWWPANDDPGFYADPGVFRPA